MPEHTLTLSTSYESEDRRKSPRRENRMRCKIYDPVTRRFTAAETTDVSGGGMQLRTNHRVEVKPGWPLCVGVAPTDNAGFIRLKDMAEMIVVRAMHEPNGATMIALQYDLGGMPVVETAREAA